MNLTLQQLLKEGSAELQEAGIAESELDARYLLFEAFHMDTVQFLMNRNQLLLEDAAVQTSVTAYRDFIGRRARRIPLQYLVGSREFMGLEFYVNQNVLIPRQDTETLVEQILNDDPKKDADILDLCTGSGCIAVSLAVLGGYRSVLGTDISEEALVVAAENARHLCKKGEQINFLKSDLFEQLEGRTFDIIVSNPPYIPTEVIKGLAPEVRDYEPMAALDGMEDGLFFYRKLAAECAAFLNPGGSIYLEIGYDQGRAVSGLLLEAGFRQIAVIKDQPGLDRVIKAIL